MPQPEPYPTTQLVQLGWHREGVKDPGAAFEGWLLGPWSPAVLSRCSPGQVAGLLQTGACFGRLLQANASRL